MKLGSKIISIAILVITFSIGYMLGNHGRENVSFPAVVAVTIALVACFTTLMMQERKRSETALRKQLNFLQVLIDAIPNPVFFKDAAGRYLGCNNAFETMIGLSRAQLLGKTVYDIAPKELADHYHEADDELFRNGGMQVYESTIATADGTHRDVIFSKATFNTADDSLGGLIGTIIDISRRKQAEAALVEQKLFSDNLLANSTVAMFVIDDQHRLLIWNKACEELTGLSADKIVGTTDHWRAFYNDRRPCLADLVLDGKMDATYAHYSIFKRSTLIAEGLEAEGWYTSLNSRDRYIMFTAAPIRNANGEIIAAIQTLEDITERKLAEEKTNQTLSLLGATLEATADGILAIDREGRLENFNRKFAEMWNLPTDFDTEPIAILDHICHQLKNPELFLARLRKPQDEDDSERFDQLDLLDGRVFESFSKPQMLDDTLIGRVWSFRDTTYRAKLENQLRHSQKMEAIGTLTGGVAHDFNNILTAVIGFSSILLHEISDSKHSQYLNQILAAAERAADLTRNLLAYSRKQTINPISLDLNLIVKNVNTFLTRVIGENVDLTCLLSDKTLPILADPRQIEQVLMNLATNARDAMDNQGTLVIRTDQVKLDHSFIEAHGYGTAGEYAMLTVADTGTGIAEDVRDRIFEPFFTTKEIGKGTGLGLAISYGIIKQHNGYINVYSEVGLGTTFHIYFPLTDQQQSEECRQEATIPVGGSETILLVEDNKDVRLMTRDVLERHGYTVIEAEDGEDAILKFSENERTIQLIISDVIMPRKSGKEAYEEIHRRNNNIKALFASGYSADLLIRNESFADNVHFISKPFSPIMLLENVRKILDSAG